MHLMLLFALAISATDAKPETLHKVPAKFDHDRIILTADAPDGSSVTFYTDTGGGWNAVRASAAKRLGLPEKGRVQVDGSDLPVTDFPRFLEQAGIPRPSVENWLKGRLVVVPDKQLDEDGFLGSRWFAGRVWDIDYPKKSLNVVDHWKPSIHDHGTALGFRSGADGKRDLNFPRITFSVDGEPLDALLDTGAMAKLTEASSVEHGLPVGTRVGTSFITKSIFERWATRHPEWKVIENAESVTGHAYPMMRVPQVTIAGYAVGPVWFSERPDENFLVWMSQSMDKQIVGAIGGSGLKYFRIVIDYPGRAAYFSCSEKSAIAAQ